MAWWSPNVPTSSTSRSSPAYQALGYDWDPAATGAVADEVTADVAAVGDSLLAAFTRAGNDLVETAIDDETLAVAKSLAADHEIA